MNRLCLAPEQWERLRRILLNVARRSRKPETVAICQVVAEQIEEMKYHRRKTAKPSWRWEVGYGGAVRIYPDGRQICLDTAAGRRQYKRRIKAMWLRQDGRCCIGGERIRLEACTFDHQDGRGAGRQDDRISKVSPESGQKVRINGAACLFHNTQKGSRRIPYAVQ